MYFIPFISNLFCEGVDELMSVESLDSTLTLLELQPTTFLMLISWDKVDLVLFTR